MKIIVFVLAALCLPFLGRFQEIRVLQQEQVIFEQSTYGQKLAAALMVVAALGLLGAARKESQKHRAGDRSQLVRFYPALFALPAMWQHWTVSRFGVAGVYTEIKSGLGGPMTNLLLIAAAGLFIAADAYWRQREKA